jgi:polar amino acid transport system substrate-binding protein
MKQFLLILFAAALIPAMVSCSKSKTEGSKSVRISTLQDLHGKKAASTTGTAFQESAEKAAPGAKITPLYFNDNTLCVQAVLTGKADAVFLDDPMAKLWVARYPDDLYVAGIYAKDEYSFATRKNSPLTARISRIIEQLEKSGELEKFKQKWCSSTDPNRKLEKWTHKKDFDGSAGVLTYATDFTQEPMSFTLKGQYVGMDIEVIARIAYELNMKLEITSMNFGSLLEALLSKKVEVVGGSMSITPSRLEKVDFVTPYYHGGLTIVAPYPKKSAVAEIEKITDLTGKRVGVLAAGTLPLLAEKFVKGVNYVYFSEYTDAVQALLVGKIDAVLIDEPIASCFVNQKPEQLKIASIFVDDEYGFALPKNSPLLARASAVVKKMEKAGDLAKLKAKWCGTDPAKKVLEDWSKQIPHTGKNGVLRFSSPTLDEPLCYINDKQQVVGYEKDVINRIAAELDMKLEFTDIAPGARMETIASGKADISGGSISITPERKEKVDFLPAHYKGGVAILVPQNVKKQSVKQPFSVKVKQFFSELKDSFDRTFIRESRWRLVLDGLIITVIITLAAAVLGTVLAFPVWLLRTAKNKFAQVCGKIFIYVMQGTPILVLLMVLYYLIFASVDIHAVIVAIIGFSLNFAAYTGEMLRTGIDSIPKGQREAALALGFNRYQTFEKVILPQALRQILPVYRREFINMLQATSIVGYIAVQDLTKASDIIRSRTYEAFFPLIATALIYFVTAWVLAGFLVWLDTRLDPAKRRSKKMESEK